MIDETLGYAAIFFFLVAAYIDCPFPDWPTPAEKLWGNFACSLGFLFSALALFFR